MEAVPNYLNFPDLSDVFQAWKDEEALPRKGEENLGKKRNFDSKRTLFEKNENSLEVEAKTGGQAADQEALPKN